MLQKFADISKILLIPGLVLYGLGFISITAYLAQFGMVTFDIINARFLIAGLYSSLSLVVVVLAAWGLHRKLSINEIFKTDKWKERFSVHISFLSILYVVCISATSFLTLGENITHGSNQDLIFKPILGKVLGKYDFVGYFLQNLTPHFLESGGFGFVFKASLYIFSYLFLIAVIVGLIILIQQHFRSDNKKELQKETPIKQAENTPKEVAAVVDKVENKYITFLIFCTDLFFICFYLCLFVFCSLKLNASLFDFSSFDGSFKLSSNLLFAWVFVSVMSLYLFLNNSGFPREQTSLVSINWTEVGKRLFDLTYFQSAIQQLLLPILISLYLFGAVIFPKIPFAIGGGQPRQVTITAIPKETLFQQGNFYLIEESSQYLFLVKKDKDIFTALQVNKDIIEYIETKKATSTEVSS